MNNIGPTWDRHAVDAADPGSPIIPGRFSVEQNYPNPFNSQTAIEFTVHRAAEVELRVFNILGQTVTSKNLGMQPAGGHSVIWYAIDDDGDELPSGVYFYRIIVESKVETKKMLLLK
jgi:flagellar hook assembly protein FlgD